MKRLPYRYQRTLAATAAVSGVGFLTGADVRLVFHPAPADTGIVFWRSDVGPEARLPAEIDRVTGTQRRTTLGRAPLQVTLVEHVLAALAGLRIDNCLIELNAPEPPGLDGSARGFVQALQAAGLVHQPARRAVWTVSSSVVVEGPGGTLAIHPDDSNDLRISYTLDFALPSPLGRQAHTQIITPETFADGLAGCRTFLLEAEAMKLRQEGLGKRTRACDLLVFGPRGPIDNKLRFANEPARHKMLDIVGDLALFGFDLRGHVVAYRSGHTQNIELVRLLTRRLGTYTATPQARAA